MRCPRTVGARTTPAGSSAAAAGAALARVCSAGGGFRSPPRAGSSSDSAPGPGSIGSRLPRLHQASSTASAHEQRLRLHDVPGRQVLRPRSAGPRKHLAVVLAGREDRRPRLNGAGKSTLLRIMAGVDKTSAATPSWRRAARVGYLAQEPKLDRRRRTSARTSRRRRADPRPARRASTRSRRRSSPSRIAEEFDELLAEQAQGAGPDRRARRLGPRPTARDRDGRAAPPAAGRDVTTLSGGERRRVALCRLLLSQPDLLLLDEPTNHLDAESVAWLERYLEEYPGTVVAVTHDRYFLDNVAGWILELDRGRGHPVRRATTRRGSSRSRRGSRPRRSRSRRGRRRSSASSSGCGCRPKARQAKSKARLAGLREAARRGAEREARRRRDPHPARPAPRRRRRRGGRRLEGVRRQAARSRT